MINNIYKDIRKLSEEMKSVDTFSVDADAFSFGRYMSKIRYKMKHIKVINKIYYSLKKIIKK